MKIDVFFTPLGSRDGDLAGRGVVVIDVLRATSTIVAAIGHGAKAVIPAATAEEAVRMTANLERDGFLLAGERRAVRIEGFALGNSPLEMTPETVAGKTVFLATTNGTPALVAAQGGEPVLVGAAVNFSALVERARAAFGAAADLAIVCAGRERQFALEDAYAAGRLVHLIGEDAAYSKKLISPAQAEKALGKKNKAKIEPLTKEQVGLIRAWIDQGAK